MPRACPVEALTFAATRTGVTEFHKMPRACPVESLTFATTREPIQTSTRCHGLAPWSLTFAATRTGVTEFHKMPRASPVEPHVRCYTDRSHRISQDATGLPRGVPHVRCLEKDPALIGSLCSGERCGT